MARTCFTIILGLSLLALPAMATPTKTLTASKAPTLAAKQVKRVKTSKQIVHPLLVKAKEIRERKASELNQQTKQVDLSGALKTGR